MNLSDLRGRRIAILGAGREGAAVVAWLHRHLPGQPLTVLAEQAPPAAFTNRLEPGDRLEVRAFEAPRLRDFDVLLRSPGVSIYRSELVSAVAAGSRIVSPSSLWFSAHAGARTVCITGTKGKSTTSALLAHVLQSCGIRTQLAGNIGRPLLDCTGAEPQWWVIELSSYQLVDLEAAPEIAVVLNLSEEHLDWHGGFRNYRRDKLRLIELAHDGTLVLGAGLRDQLEAAPQARAVVWLDTAEAVLLRGGKFLYGQEWLEVAVPAGLPGEHNLWNIAAALTVAARIGVDLRSAAAAVETFQCLPHRLQTLGTSGGVAFIDDSIASTPLSTAAALDSLAGRSVILLVGGVDRGVDWSPHVPAFLRHPPEAVIGLPDNGERIAGVLAAHGLSPRRGYFQASDLTAAVRLARQVARPGDTVLLSPGAPSFNCYADFAARGRAFAEAAGFAGHGS